MSKLGQLRKKIQGQAKIIILAAKKQQETQG